MTKYNLRDLYDRCLNASYTHVEHDGDFAIQREGNILFLLLEWTHGGADWSNNFKFFAKPYKHMETTWFCHRGFLRVWKSIEPYVKSQLMDPTVQEIVIVGYSHGAALAGIAHEYVWFNRPDLRENLVSYGFGAPRFFWGPMQKSLRERWKNFHPVRNLDDLVTHVPPVLFGFRHANKLIVIGKRGLYNLIDAHRPENYQIELSKYESEHNNNETHD